MSHTQREQELQQTAYDISLLRLYELRLIRARFADMLAVATDPHAREIIQMRGEAVHAAITAREATPTPTAARLVLNFRRKLISHSPFHIKRLLTVPGFAKAWQEI
jgi:hypothetical protein